MVNMDWEVLAAVTEIISAGALLATLFYIAKQIRVQSDQLRRSNYHQSAQSTMSNNALYVQIWQPLMQDRDLAQIYLKALSGEALNETESLQFGIYTNTFLALTEAAFYQTASGVGFDDLSDEGPSVLETLAPYLRKILLTDAGGKWYGEEAHALFTSDFLEAVEQHLNIKD